MKRIQRNRNHDEGFTLIELLMVIIILAILATVVVFSVTGITNNGEVAACQTQLRTINTAAESYFAQNSAPSPDLETLVTAGFLHADNNFKTGVASYNSVAVGTGANVYTVVFAPGSAGPPATAGNATSTTCS